MNKIFKAISLFAVMALAAASCSKWTEQQSVDFKYQTAQNKYPQRYEQYLKSLREYRSSEHQVLIAKFDNAETMPVSSAYNLTCFPDSVDYIVLNGVVVNNATLSQINQIKEEKGILTLYSTDITAARKAYSNYVKAYLEANPGTEEEPVTEADITEVDYLKAIAEDAVKTVKSYGLDGISVYFSEKNPVAMGEEEYQTESEAQEAFFTPILDYIKGNEALFFFEGNPKYAIDKGMLEIAKFIIIPAEDATLVTGLNYAVNKAVDENVPSDKYVIGVSALDVTDATATNGLFSTASSATVGAAEWAVEPAGYGKCGISVNHAQFDYFHMNATWSEISTAISIMNPSPVK